MSNIDHDERRRRIADVAVDVIARQGLEAATIRRIAAEVGYSTTIVTHYFADKAQLLLWTYRALAERGRREFERVTSRDPSDLVGSLLSMIAADEGGRRRWRVYVAFWDYAGREPLFAEEQRLRVEDALATIAGVIRARNGERDDVDRISRALNALVQGISLQALIDEASWPPDEIRRTLVGYIDGVLGPPLARPAA